MNQIPRPEYPRMQFRREDFWLNLNGPWRCKLDYSHSAMAAEDWKKPEWFDRTIRVPFCPESPLSGIGETDFLESIFYTRKIQIPAAWSGRRVLLHLGGSDYRTSVWLDGVWQGIHYGGSASFSFDLTNSVRPAQEQTLVIHVADEQRSGLQGSGKQSDRPESYGCLYTRTTGIWQTVWLESIPEAGLLSCKIIPLFDDGAFRVEPVFEREHVGMRFRAALSADGKILTEAICSATAGAALQLTVPCPRAWTPDDPYLYDLDLYVLQADGSSIDHVKSYAGLRKLHLTNGKLHLNNRPLFQRLVLDQGFYEEGIWTAPDDQTLRRDIELGKAAGFNGARLHQKVFEERYLYWADRLGYLVWGEYPSWGISFYKPDACLHFLNEWREIVLRDRNHPSLIVWTPLNESCAPDPAALARMFRDTEDQERYRELLRSLYALTKELDSLRPFHDVSGYLHVKTDLWSVHLYRPDAESLQNSLHPQGAAVYSHCPEFECAYCGQPYLVDEFGGFRYLPEERRTRSGNGWGYHDFDLKTPAEFLQKIAEQIDVLLNDPTVSGYCYTQLYDVEQEQNGLLCYDRTPKVPLKSLAALFGKAPHR